MAHSDRISQDRTINIARQIVQRIPSGSSLLDMITPSIANSSIDSSSQDTTSIHLCESFRIYQLNSYAFTSSSSTVNRIRSLRSFITPTERWHHQLHAPDAPPGTVGIFARSRATTEEEATQLQTNHIVTQIAAPVEGAQLAQRLDNVILWLDSLDDSVLPGNPLVRLLEIPRLYLTTLHLIQRSTDSHHSYEKVVIVDTLPALMEADILRFETLYAPNVFLEKIRQLAVMVNPLPADREPPPTEIPVE